MEKLNSLSSCFEITIRNVVSDYSALRKLVESNSFCLKYIDLDSSPFCVMPSFVCSQSDWPAVRCFLDTNKLSYLRSFYHE